MKKVLIALHYQNEVLHPGGKIKVGMAQDAQGRHSVIDNAARLLAFSRRADIPVVSVRIGFRADHADVIQNCTIFRNVVAGKAMVDGSWGAEFHEGLGPEDGEHVVKHTRVNAFFGSQLGEVLHVLGARQLIVAGVATHSVVLTTVACAADIGYEVVVAADACSSGTAHLHEAALEMMRPVAEISDVQSIIDRHLRPAG